ncbi:hypothetical protein T265_05732 [Opisthorchis viverrini]|uniref:Uncharacterized protein n=1 Tax=Opisthorchis viverrini TaxID=6198 RepID=A0A075AEY7_OPIVI|nr:hypothetical protein T265_05732 [Opisthorchis viverrini]KER27199.1 hypothetical protein T265_05732 [Opisthorchis viverrini]
MHMAKRLNQSKVTRKSYRSHSNCLLGGIPHGSHTSARIHVLLRPRTPSHARLAENLGRLPVRHQAKI